MVFTVRRESDWLGLFFVCVIAITVAAGTLAAQSQDETTPQETNEKIQQLAALARTTNTDPPVGAGDLLHIDVFDVPELSRDARVTDSGVISFPLVPEPIPASGLTTFQLEHKIEQVLSADGLVSHPQVSVFVKEQASQPVTIVGAVGHPTVMQIVRPTSLLEALASAGGVADDAGSMILITRPAPAAEHVQPVSAKDVNSQDPLPDPEAKTIKISLYELLDSGNSDYNIQVRGGDIVSVPRAGVVYVLGFGVSQQGEYVLQARGEQVTALKAVALAHGLTSFAKADDSVIMRTDPKTGKRIEIHVHLKKIQNHKADDVPLLSNDILYVPDSKGKKALARGTEAAIGIGTSVAIYHVAY
ncbi:MAG TPA: polysaccharide biosynthesis/export family protein [Candidatus Acidoferrales bacterium]|nr:polysaccharide biosynthesis/export family protein [Candidatus Acidoferrales bacterium]